MSINNKRKKWHDFVDKMVQQQQYSPKDIYSATFKKFPELNQATLKNYISIARAKQRETGGSARGAYSCPECGNDLTKITYQEYFSDYGSRVRACTCGYTWKTIEIDTDMYASIMGGRIH